VMEKGVMERVLPAKPSDVPGAPATAPASTPSPSGTTGASGSAPSDVPK
jgi:hypothetical protein